VLNRRLPTGEAQAGERLNTGPSVRPYGEAHTLRARRTLVGNVTPPKPPRSAGRHLKDPQPGRSGLLQPTRLRQRRSKRVVRLPLGIVREVRVKPATATDADPTLARTYIEGTPTSKLNHKPCRSTGVNKRASLLPPSGLELTRPIFVTVTPIPGSHRFRTTLRSRRLVDQPKAVDHS
jgi:hypothetical protein